MVVESFACADENGDGKADDIKYYGLYDCTGIKLHKGHVYDGADTLIARYKLYRRTISSFR